MLGVMITTECAGLQRVLEISCSKHGSLQWKDGESSAESRKHSASCRAEMIA